MIVAASVQPARGDPIATELSPPRPSEPRYRHFAGLQVGGTSPIALDYRYRLAGPLLLDVGGFGAPEAVMILTAGLVVEVHESERLVTYVGGGGTAALLGNLGLLFAYPRVGLAVKLGAWHEHWLALDVGCWLGRRTTFDRDTGKTVSDRRFALPMAGLSYLFAFGRPER